MRLQENEQLCPSLTGSTQGIQTLAGVDKALKSVLLGHSMLKTHTVGELAALTHFQVRLSPLLCTPLIGSALHLHACAGDASADAALHCRVHSAKSPRRPGRWSGTAGSPSSSPCFCCCHCCRRIFLLVLQLFLGILFNILIFDSFVLLLFLLLLLIVSL